MYINSTPTKLKLYGSDHCALFLPSGNTCDLGMTFDSIRTANCPWSSTLPRSCF